MLVRSLVVAGLVGLSSLAINIATAETAVAPAESSNALSGISFFDADADWGARDNVKIDLSARDMRNDRFRGFSGASPNEAGDAADRHYEVALRADNVAGLPVDVSIAQSASIGFDSGGDVARQGRGSELRLGRGIGMRQRNAASWDNPTWYFFAASDDEALTWQPGARSAFGGSGQSFALQERVEIGDMQAGITYDVGVAQASFAYVEREVSTYIAARTISQDESFAGVTLTMRR